MRMRIRWVAVVAAAVVGVMALTACGSKIPSTPSAGGTSSKPCGTVNIAQNPWVGYEADAAVVAYVLRNRLGCTVNIKNLTEEVSWQGFGPKTVDVILENWGHADLVTKYIDTQKVAVDFGQTGNKGIIGWYVPPWLAAAYPDVTNYANLNKYADKFKTSESGGKGQLLDGDPSYVTNDESLVKNLGLNFKVVYAGSEDALIAAFKSAEQNHTWVIGYFYEPQWFLSEIKLVHVTLPPYTPGCDSDPKTIKCDYPPYDLNKIVSASFANSGSPAASFVKSFNWTNDDQNAVALDIHAKMSDDAAAKKWVDANPTKVNAWLQSS